MQYATGTELIIVLLVTLAIVVLYYASVVLTHVKVIRLTLGEAVLLSMFSGTLMLMLGLLIGQQFAIALYVFFVFLAFSVLLFVKKANRWYIERAIRKAESTSIQKERKDRGDV